MVTCNDPTEPPRAITAQSALMTDVINLRTMRKRAARKEAERSAAENRITHGVSKSERGRVTTDEKRTQRMLDQHKIESGDRR